MQTAVVHYRQEQIVTLLQKCKRSCSLTCVSQDSVDDTQSFQRVVSRTGCRTGDAALPDLSSCRQRLSANGSLGFRVAKVNPTPTSTSTDISFNLPKSPHATSALRGKCGNGAQDSSLCDSRVHPECVSFMHTQVHVSGNSLECSEKLSGTFETNSVCVVSVVTDTEAEGEGPRKKRVCTSLEARTIGTNRKSVPKPGTTSGWLVAHV